MAAPRRKPFLKEADLLYFRGGLVGNIALTFKEEALIPNDDRLSEMTPAEINKLANVVATIGTENDLERLSDAILRINKGWNSGAHSELSDTRRNRYIAGREARTDILPDVLVLPISDAIIRKEISKAQKAALTRRQQEVWVLCEIAGLSQGEAARKLKIKQCDVSRALQRAKNALRNYIDKQGILYNLFADCAHRSAPLKLQARPALPPAINEARAIIEEMTGAETLIQNGRFRSVEIWPRDCFKNNYAGIQVLTFRDVQALAKELQQNKAKISKNGKIDLEQLLQRRKRKG